GAAGGGTGAGAAAFAAGAGAAFFSAAGAVFTAAPSPSQEIVPTTVFTWTVVPSVTFISCRTPEAGAGISASTLSVEISNSGSSRWILSPGFFSHLVMVPSTMDSPIWGITISVAMGSFQGGSYWGAEPSANSHYSEGQGDGCARRGLPAAEQSAISIQP